ncbi:MAG: hypothetical protein U0228_36230 [Myxococcaceae bacterium]
MSRPWIVTPHKPLQQLESNLWCLESQVPGSPANRRMSIVRTSDGGLVFYHAVPMDEPTLEKVRSLGTPRALVIGHHQHGIDAEPFAAKLGIGIYGPDVIEARMRKRWPMLAGNISALPKDPWCRFEALDGTRWGEPVEIVTSGDKVSLVWCDAFVANDDADLPFMSRVLGFGGGPRVIPMFKWFLTSDVRKLKAHLEQLAALPGLTHLVACHGKIVSEDAPGVLRRAAAAL